MGTTGGKKEVPSLASHGRSANHRPLWLDRSTTTLPFPLVKAKLYHNLNTAVHIYINMLGLVNLLHDGKRGHRMQYISHHCVYACVASASVCLYIESFYLLWTAAVISCLSLLYRYLLYNIRAHSGSPFSANLTVKAQHYVETLRMLNLRYWFAMVNLAS